MSGLAYALGGALAGLGQGQAMVGKLNYEQQREMALEELRNQNKQTQQQSQYDLMDRNAARQNERTTDASIIKAREDEGIQTRRDQRQHGYDVTLENIRFGNQKALAAAKAELDKGNAQFEANLKSGQIKEIVDGGDGYIYGVDAFGNRKNLGITVPPSKSASSGSATLDKARGKNQPAAGAPSSIQPGRWSNDSSASAPERADGGTAGLPRVRSPEEARALPKGTKFILPDGRIGTR